MIPPEVAGAAAAPMEREYTVQWKQGLVGPFDCVCAGCKSVYGLKIVHKCKEAKHG